MKAIFVTLGFLCLSGLAHAGQPTLTSATTRALNTQAAPQDAAELERLRGLAKQSKDDPEPWREYAEALANSGDAREAAKAFGEAVERYINLYKAGGGLRSAAPDEAARNRAERAAKLRRAPEAIERYIQLGGAKGFERQQLEALAAHARLLNETDPARGVYNPTELDRKARIVSKPEPALPQAALNAGTRGAVRMRAVLAGDGKVKHIFVIKGLPNGLSESGVEAASRVKFEPAMKDGKPVSQIIILEYFFNAY